MFYRNASHTFPTPATQALAGLGQRIHARLGCLQRARRAGRNPLSARPGRYPLTGRPGQSPKTTDPSETPRPVARPIGLALKQSGQSAMAWAPAPCRGALRAQPRGE